MRSNYSWSGALASSYLEKTQTCLENTCLLWRMQVDTETLHLTCEQLSDGLVLPAGGADEQQPGGQELVVTGQELSDGPGGSGGGALLSFSQLQAFIHRVHQQEEGLLWRFDAQQRQKDAPAWRERLALLDCSSNLSTTPS